MPQNSSIAFLKGRIFSRRISIILVSFLGLVGGVFLFLFLTGFFRDPQVALRELKRQKIEPTFERVVTAIQGGEGEKLSLLKRAGVDFSKKDQAGNTVVHWAIYEKRDDFLPLLLEAGASVDEKNAKGMPPLAYALERGALSSARQLLKSGASPDLKALNGEPALVSFLTRGIPPVFDLLLMSGANPNVVGKANTPPLLLALENGKLAEALALIDRGADPNATFPTGRPVVHDLCEHWREWGLLEEDAAQVLEQLAKHDADLELPDASGVRPLQIAISHQFKKGQDVLFPRVKDVSNTLWRALDINATTAVPRILEKGADPNNLGPRGETPLVEMIRKGQASLVSILLDHGADPERLCREGQRALPFAIILNRPEVTLALLNHKRTPAYDLTLNDPVDLKFTQLFAEKGYLYWYLNNESGITPLMLAVLSGQLEVVEKLLERGADRFQKSRNRVFPIQMAADTKNVSMQQLLIGVPYDDDAQKRHFVIDLSEQRVRFFENGELVKNSSCSTGRSDFRTPTGNFVITDKTRHKKSNIYEEASMPYFQRFSCKDFGFHEGPLPGYPASHGCIRLPRSTARLFWKRSRIGDRVRIQK